MRSIIVILVLFLGIFGFAQTTKDKIKSQTGDLLDTQKTERELSRKLDDIAKDIRSNQNYVEETSKKISNLAQNVDELEEMSSSELKELEQLNLQNSLLLSKQSDIEDKITQLIAQDLSFEAISSQNVKSISGIISSEVISNLNDIALDEIKELGKTYEQNAKQITQKSTDIERINRNLQEFKTKKAELANTREKQKNSLDKLERDKSVYSKKLDEIKAQQEAIRSTLANLKIIDDKEEIEAKKKAELEQKKATLQQARLDELEEKKKAKNLTQKESKEVNKLKVSVEESKAKVKQYGSSYQASRVKRYGGAKTIAPLESFTVLREFGNYTDPVYNIKIFNESVVLRSNLENAKVISVFGGKVVFANDTAVLDKVVIVENPGGIHTIYAHLNQIAPTIKVGSYVQKGYVIGRVSRDLTFEITQQNYHLDPLTVIAVK